MYVNLKNRESAELLKSVSYRNLFHDFTSTDVMKIVFDLETGEIINIHVKGEDDFNLYWFKKGSVDIRKAKLKITSRKFGL